MSYPSCTLQGQRLITIKMKKRDLFYDNERAFMDINLTDYSLPPQYTRNGKPCFLDPIREKLIPVTPEEQVRQKVVAFLTDQVKVPQDMIELEVPMCHFKKGARGRADILVYGMDKCKDEQIPALIIECKAPDIALIDRHYDQVYRYDKVSGAGTIALTNGRDFIIETQDSKKNKYQELRQIPTYQDLLTKSNLVVDDTPFVPWKRPDFSQIKTPSVIQEFKDYQNIGDDTDKQLHPFIANLAGFIEDESWKMKPQVLNGINIIADTVERVGE